MYSRALYFGKNIVVDGITIYQYRIDEIEDAFGIDIFRDIMYTSVRKPIDFFDRRKVSLRDVEEIELFKDIICKSDNELKYRYLIMFSVATKLEWEWNDITKEFVSYTENDILRINSKNIKQILDVIAKTYSITRYDPFEKYGDYDSADSYTKEVIYDLIQEEIEESLNKDSGITSIIEGIACNKDSGVNIFTVGKLTLYQLFRVYMRVSNKVNHDNVMLSAYCNSTLKDGFNMQDVSLFREL